jgi:MSHA biogenesis protein MshQ
VVLNEINTKAAPDYVELYFLSPLNLQPDSWYLWVDDHQAVAIPAGEYATGDFLLLEMGLNPADQEVMLISDSVASLSVGMPVVLDYLGYGGGANFRPHWDVPSACGTVYLDHSANEPVIDRLPDGTGAWADHAEFATPGGPNDGSGSSCSLGGFAVSAQDYALACPDQRAEVSISALCVDGRIKSDYQGTLELSSNQASARFYLTSSGASPVIQLNFDGSEGGIRSVYVSDHEEQLTGITVSDGNASGHDSIDFRATGLLVSEVPGIAACTDQITTVTAYGRDQSSDECGVIEGFNGSKSLKAWFDYLQPNDNPSGTPLVLVDAHGAQGLPIGKPVDDNIELNFNNGIAMLPVSYADAGQVQFHLQHDRFPYDGSEFNPMQASSNAFTVKPTGYSLRAFGMPGEIELTNGGDKGEPLWPAGTDFRLQVQARCNNGALLSNYRPSAAEMGVEMLLPAAGYSGTLVLKGNSYPSSYATLDWTNLSSLFTDGMIVDDSLDSASASFSEVGVFRLHIRDTNYLGETIDEQSLTVGRFTPAYFEVSGTQDGQLQPDCGSFSYTGSASHYLIAPSLTITTRNALGGTTRNYTAGFMKLTEAEGGSIVIDPPSADASQLGADASQHAAVSSSLVSNLASLQDHADGTLTYILSSLDSFTYMRNGNALIAPYISDLDLPLVSITDGDGVSDNGAPVVLRPVGMELRYGRLILDDAFGPQTDPLTLPVRAQFFNGSGFVDNSEDYCTRITPIGAIGLDNWQADLSPGETQVIATADLLAGRGEITLAAPGPGSQSDSNDGSVELTLDLSLTAPAQGWLLNDENGDGAFAENPRGRAGFGMYRGDDRFLYWRESR